MRLNGASNLTWAAFVLGAVLLGTGGTGCATGKSGEKAASARIKGEGGLALGEVGSEVQVRLLSTGDGLIVAVSSEEYDGPTTFHHVTADGSIAWKTTLNCPPRFAFDSPFIVSDRLVCKGDEGIVGLSLQDGREVWRFPADQTLYMTMKAGDRVLTSVANQTLAVLDGATGQVLNRFSLDDQPLEAGAMTDIGPIGLIVGGTGEDEDPYTLLAQPVGTDLEDASAADNPLEPAWNVPFDAYSMSVTATGTAVIGMPINDLIVSRALSTGDLNWVEYAGLLPAHALVESGMVFVGELDTGANVIGLMDPATRFVRWSHSWPYPTVPGTVSDGDGLMGFASDQGWAVYQTGDGAAVAGASLPDGASLLDMAVTRSMVGVVMAQGQERVLKQIPLNTASPPPGGAISAPDPVPAWFEEGTILLYALILHDGIDPDTGYARDARVNVFKATIESVTPDLAFSWEINDGRKGSRVIPAAVLETASKHSDMYEDGEERLVVDRSTVWVSRKVLGEILDAGEAEFFDDACFRPTTLRKQGDGFQKVTLHNITTGEEPKEEKRDVLIPTVFAEGDYNAGKYWIAPYRDFPLIVRAERPRFTVLLSHIFQIHQDKEE